jgi:hypothetical protein
MATTERSAGATTRTADTPEQIGEGIAETARSVASGVADAANDVGARLPEVAQSTRDAFAEANRMVHGGSDQTLKLVGALSVGLAVGLLVGGANRILVILATLPAALIGATLVERMEGTATTPSHGSTTGSRS